jgi:hypothetical protein
MKSCDTCGVKESKEDTIKNYSVSDREDADGEIKALCEFCADEEKWMRQQISVGWCTEVN